VSATVRNAEDELNCAEEWLDALSIDLPMKRTDFDCIGDYIVEVVAATRRAAMSNQPAKPAIPDSLQFAAEKAVHLLSQHGFSLAADNLTKALAAAKGGE